MRHSIAAGLLLASIAAPAWAALPHGTLQFVTPNATVAANEPIPIWVRLTLDVDSPALSFSSNPLTGFAAADLPTQGVYYDSTSGQFTPADFAQVTRAVISAAMTCTSSFNCSPNAVREYSFDFASTLNPNLPGLVYQDHFQLAPGQSVDYLFGQFTPKDGGATPGVYQLFQTQMTLEFGGLSADGRYLTAVNRPVIAQTCADGNFASCAFTRNVVAAVPEPSSWLLLGLGLPLLAAARRRRSDLRP